MLIKVSVICLSDFKMRLSGLPVTGRRGRKEVAVRFCLGCLAKGALN